MNERGTSRTIRVLPVTESPPTNPRSKSWRKKLLTLVVSGLVACLIAELVARRTYEVPWPEERPLSMVEAHPTRGWRMVPSLEHYTYDKLVRVNSLGMRGPEVPEKSPDRLRVIALGDSLVYGQGAGEDETLPVHLEAYLNQSDEEERGWEVLNAGNRAYGTEQELALLEELGPVLEPDVVVVFWFHNDLEGRDLKATHERLTASGPIAFDTGNAMKGLDLWSWRAKQVARSSALFMTLYDRVLNPEAGRVKQPPSWDPHFEALDEQLDRFGELERELGFELLFCVIPFGPTLGDTSHWGVPLEKRAIELIQAKGIPVRMLDEELRAIWAATGSVPVIPYDGHYLGEGNRALALDASRFVLEVL